MFDQIIHQILESLATALAGMLVAVAVKYFQKLHLSVSAEQQAQLELYAKQGILKAEEMGMAVIKHNTIAPLSPQEKTQLAVEHINTMLPSVADDKARATVIALVASTGSGATNNPAPKP